MNNIGGTGSRVKKYKIESVEAAANIQEELTPSFLLKIVKSQPVHKNLSPRKIFLLKPTRSPKTTNILPQGTDQVDLVVTSVVIQ